MGPDWLSGIAFKDPKVNGPLLEQIKKCLDSGVVPTHLKRGKLIALSKTGNSTVTVIDTRPIVVLSHAHKLIEKTIAARLKKAKSKMLVTPEWQRGFKEGFCCTENLTDIIATIAIEASKRKKDGSCEIFLAVDFSKAYDTMLRDLLISILEQSAVTDVERHSIELIKSLYKD